MRMHQIKTFFIYAPKLGEIFLFVTKTAFSVKLRPIKRHGSQKTDLRHFFGRTFVIKGLSGPQIMLRGNIFDTIAHNVCRTADFQTFEKL